MSFFAQEDNFVQVEWELCNIKGGASEMNYKR